MSETKIRAAIASKRRAEEGSQIAAVNASSSAAGPMHQSGKPDESGGLQRDTTMAISNNNSNVDKDQSYRSQNKHMKETCIEMMPVVVTPSENFGQSNLVELLQSNSQPPSSHVLDGVLAMPDKHLRSKEQPPVVRLMENNRSPELVHSKLNSFMSTNSKKTDSHVKNHSEQKLVGASHRLMEERIADPTMSLSAKSRKILSSFIKSNHFEESNKSIGSVKGETYLKSLKSQLSHKHATSKPPRHKRTRIYSVDYNANMLRLLYTELVDEENEEPSTQSLVDGVGGGGQFMAANGETNTLLAYKKNNSNRDLYGVNSGLDDLVLFDKQFVTGGAIGGCYDGSNLKEPSFEDIQQITCVVQGLQLQAQKRQQEMTSHRAFLLLVLLYIIIAVIVIIVLSQNTRMYRILTSKPKVCYDVIDPGVNSTSEVCWL